MTRSILKFVYLLVGLAFTTLGTGSLFAQSGPECRIEVTGIVNQGYLNTGSGNQAIGHQGYGFRVVYDFHGEPAYNDNRGAQQFLRWDGPANGGTDNQNVSVEIISPAGEMLARARSSAPGTKNLNWNLYDLTSGDRNVLDHYSSTGQFQTASSSGQLSGFRAYFDARSSTNVFDAPVDYLTESLDSLIPTSGRDSVIVNGDNNFYIRVDNAVTSVQSTRYSGGCQTETDTQPLTASCGDVDIVSRLEDVINMIQGRDDMASSMQNELIGHLRSTQAVYSNSSIPDLDRAISAIAAIDGYFDSLWVWPEEFASSETRVEIMQAAIDIKETLHCLYATAAIAAEEEDSDDTNSGDNGESFEGIFSALYEYIANGNLNVSAEIQDELLAPLSGILAIMMDIGQQGPTQTDIDLALAYMNQFIESLSDYAGNEIDVATATQIQDMANALVAMLSG